MSPVFTCFSCILQAPIKLCGFISYQGVLYVSIWSRSPLIHVKEWKKLNFGDRVPSVCQPDRMWTKDRRMSGLYKFVVWGNLLFFAFSSLLVPCKSQHVFLWYLCIYYYSPSPFHPFYLLGYGFIHGQLHDRPYNRAVRTGFMGIISIK